METFMYYGTDEHLERIREGAYMETGHHAKRWTYLGDVPWPAGVWPHDDPPGTGHRDQESSTQYVHQPNAGWWSGAALDWVTDPVFHPEFGSYPPGLPPVQITTHPFIGGRFRYANHQRRIWCLQLQDDTLLVSKRCDLTKGDGHLLNAMFFQFPWLAQPKTFTWLEYNSVVERWRMNGGNPDADRRENGAEDWSVYGTTVLGATWEQIADMRSVLVASGATPLQV